MNRPRILASHARYFVAVGMLALAGCECDEGLAQLEGSLEIEPFPVDFGEVPRGSEKRVVLTLRNTGTFSLDIEGYSATGPFVAPTGTSSITAGGEIQVEVAFRPTDLGLAEGVLSIQTDEPDAPTAEVPLSGVGIEAAVVVDPLVVDFGEINWTRDTELAVREVTVSNPGTDAFELTAVTLEESASDAFGLDPKDVIGSFEAGASKTFEVSYLPVAFGAASGLVAIETTAPQGERITVSLEGQAVGPRLAVCAGVTGEGELCTEAGEVPIVDFGFVDRNGSASGQIRVKNVGDRPLTVQGQTQGSTDEITISPDPDMFGQFELSAGGEQLFDVSYVPADYQFDSAIVGFGSNAAVDRTRTVRVDAKISRPVIRVIPETVTFSLMGGVNRGESTVRVFNCGEIALTLPQNVVINQTGGPGSVFSLVGAPTGGTQLPPQGTDCESQTPGASFTVVFEPAADGVYTAEIPIASDDPINALVTVDVSGDKR